VEATPASLLRQGTPPVPLEAFAANDAEPTVFNDSGLLPPLHDRIQENSVIGPILLHPVGCSKRSRMLVFNGLAKAFTLPTVRGRCDFQGQIPVKNGVIKEPFL